MWSASGTVKLAHPYVVGQPVFDAAGRHLAWIRYDGSALIGPLEGPMHAVPHRVRGEPPVLVDPSPRRSWPPMQTPPAGAFSPDGRQFATTDGYRSARIWDSASGSPVTQPLTHDKEVRSVRFSPDGRRVVTASADGAARVWDAGSGASVVAVLGHPARVEVNLALFSPDGRSIITTASDHKLRVWDAASSQLKATLSGHAAMVVSAELSPDGALLLTASHDHSARIWNLATGALATPPLEHQRIVGAAKFSPDATRVLTVSGRLVQLWDARTGRVLGAPFEHSNTVASAMFSPDGNSVVTAARTVQIWNASLDSSTLDDWIGMAGAGAYPELTRTLGGIVPAALPAP
jgi:WD40 repeat protein